MAFVRYVSAAQVYLVLDCDAQERPSMMVNFSVSEDNEWRHMEVDILPPACVPLALASYGSVFRVRTPGGAMMLPSCVQSGIFLTVGQLKHICGALDIKTEKKGTGKNGRIVKFDFAKALVNGLFPEAEATEKKRMIDIICNRAESISKCTDPEVLEVVSRLDAENADAPCWKKMAKVALQELEQDIVAKAKKAGKAEAADELNAAAAASTVGNANGAPGKHAAFVKTAGMTPPELKQLLPKNGVLKSQFYIKHHPIGQYFKAEYPCLLLSQPCTATKTSEQQQRQQQKHQQQQ